MSIAKFILFSPSGEFIKLGNHEVITAYKLGDYIFHFALSRWYKVINVNAIDTGPRYINEEDVPEIIRTKLALLDV